MPSDIHVLIVEMPEDQWMWIVAHFHESCRIHELPSAEQLGRVAHEAQKFARQQDATYSYRQWGHAILDALTKRTGGGEAK